MPSIATTKLYEAFYILDPDLGEEQVSAITGRYRQIIETNGGTVPKVDVWERRKLAYEIKGKNEGICVVMYFTGESKVEAELRRIFQISEDQIRFMIVKPEESTVPAADAPARPAAVAAPAQVAAPAPAPEAVAEQAPVADSETGAPPAEAAPETPAAAPATDEPAPSEPVAA